MASVELDPRSPSMKMTVKIRRYHEWSIRLWVGLQLIRLAAWLAWFGLEEEENDFFYDCPNCRRRVGYDLSPADGEVIIACSFCSYQVLMFFRSPIFASKEYECEHGCGWEEPYGFVSMDDCPIHDMINANN